jgi:hypothetical protein
MYIANHHTSKRMALNAIAGLGPLSPTLVVLDYRILDSYGISKLAVSDASGIIVALIFKKWTHRTARASGT